MIATIRMSAMDRGITRLCHFTPSRNLVHIATDPRGVLASTHLTEGDKSVFNPTDAARLDGYSDHVCCSVQYPNAWYFRKARAKDQIFRDWVVLLFKPRYLWMKGTKFCPRNAAASRGSNVREGLASFESLFAPAVRGAYEKTYRRMASHPLWLTTDDQAEVLIPDRVVREDVIGIAVIDDSQARREIARMEQLRKRVPRIVVAPLFFDPGMLSSTLRGGVVPLEREFYPGDDNE